MKYNLFPIVTITGLTLALAACNATQTDKTAPATNFDTPPAWLDRVEIVAYTPQAHGAGPLGDYENEPSRFFFRPRPITDDEESYGEEAMEDDGGGGLPEGINFSQSFSPPGGG